MLYYKSDYTNQVYEVEEAPKYQGYTQVSQQDYIEWQMKTYGEVCYPPKK